jgi:putative transcriptional regulator
MIDPGPGILLIADPFLKDPNFLRTVVFLCEHNEDGCFGFVVNKSYSNTLEELVEEADGVTLPVYYGGPVQVNTIHFLHQYPEQIPNGTEVLNGIYWGGDFDKAIDLVKSGKIDSNKIRFFIGYSGWEAGQLEDELKEKSWITANASRNLVFHKNTDEIWKDALRQMGGDYEMMINFPIDPQLN